MLLLNRYEYNPQTDFIADGGNSVSYKAVDVQNGNVVAIKFYYELSLPAEVFRANMERTKRLSHPNLVSLYDYFEFEHVNFMGKVEGLRVGVWEYIEQTPWGTFEADQTLTEGLVRDLLKGIQYLHAEGCVHSDLTMANILMYNKSEVKLNNYEITRGAKTDLTFYIAPENLLEQSTKEQSADFWALGVVLHQLFAEKLPFDTNLPVAQSVVAPIPSLPSTVREVYGAFIGKCLVVAPEQRAQSADELLLFLDRYDRNKRFNQVVPLSEEQFTSRYLFDPENDKIGEEKGISHYEAFDNLLDQKVKLSAVLIENDAQSLNAFDLTMLGHVFKVLVGDEEPRTMLVGVHTTQQVAIPLTDSHTSNNKLEEKEAEKSTSNLPIFVVETESDATDAPEPAAFADAEHDKTATPNSEMQGMNNTYTSESYPTSDSTISPVEDIDTHTQSHKNDYPQAITQQHIETEQTENSNKLDHTLPDHQVLLIDDELEKLVMEVSKQASEEPEEMSDEDFLKTLLALEQQEAIQMPQDSEVPESADSASFRNDKSKMAENDYLHSPAPIASVTDYTQGKAAEEQEQVSFTDIIRLEAIKELEQEMSASEQSIAGYKWRDLNSKDDMEEENTLTTDIIRLEALHELKHELEDNDETIALGDIPDDTDGVKTEFIELEAMSQVQRDIERLLAEKLKKTD